MLISILALLGQSDLETAPQSGTGSLRLGFFALGLILVLAMAVTYLWARRGTTRPEQHCPNCKAIRRGEFCAVCGAKF